MYVSRYKITRHYGGPEEGGWWYDRQRFSGTIASDLSKEEAKQLAGELNARAKADRLQPSGTYQGRFSVANHTDHYYFVEDEPGKLDDTDKPRPHYE
jgi:hypothetical protein